MDSVDGQLSIAVTGGHGGMLYMKSGCNGGSGSVTLPCVRNTYETRKKHVRKKSATAAFEYVPSGTPLRVNGALALLGGMGGCFLPKITTNNTRGVGCGDEFVDIFTNFQHFRHHHARQVGDIGHKGSFWTRDIVNINIEPITARNASNDGA